MTDKIVWAAVDFEIVKRPGQKGDVAGHPFRGNQWTSGQGEDLSLPAASRSALVSYAGSGFREINAHLRGQSDKLKDLAKTLGASPGDLEHEASRKVQAIDAAMLPIDKPVTLYRGLAGTAIGQLLGISRQQVNVMANEPSAQETYVGVLQNLVGTEFVDKGFVSTSSDLLTARTWSPQQGNVSMDITVPAGVRSVDMERIARRGESEVVLERGLRYRITGFEMSKTGFLDLPVLKAEVVK